jgi:hypothetical protein
LGKSIVGRSEYSFYGLWFFFNYATGGLVRPSKKDEYIKKGVELRQKLLDKLGTDGVLFYPTFPQSAMRHCESPSKMSGVMYTMIFNVLGFPSTHVPVSFITSPFISAAFEIVLLLIADRQGRKWNADRFPGNKSTKALTRHHINLKSFLI